MVVYVDASEQNAVVVGLTDQAGVMRAQINRRGQWHQSSKIVGLVQELCTRLRVAPKAINGVIVVRGPGGFTAVRLSVAIANALGYTAKMPVVGIERGDADTTATLLARGWVKFKRARASRLVTPLYAGQPNITSAKQLS